jgi:hypothetical protein
MLLLLKRILLERLSIDSIIYVLDKVSDDG